jgi:dTDP-glucose 4,6-dehydratase
MDLRAPIAPHTAARLGDIDVIMNIASESHVDRSIDSPREFIENNTALMLTMLEYARQVRPTLFLHMSTDEVYGPAYGGYLHKEWDTILPSNPYSASKAAQEAIAFSYWRTYGVPLVITNTMNIIGEMQDFEKFVPKVMSYVHHGWKMPIHASAQGVAGSRYYLHARNLADAWLFLARNYLESPGGIPMFTGHGHTRPDRFNIVGEREVSNLEMAQMIADFMGKPLLYELTDFHSSRPGHDLRYALDGRSLEDVGWKAPLSLDDSLRRTVQWTMERPEWLR